MRDEQCFADLDEILAQARLPNVAVKASSLPCSTDDSYQFRRLMPYPQRTFDAFGTDRIMWGSDLTRRPCTYLECLDHMRFGLPFLTHADRARVLGGTAARLLR